MKTALLLIAHALLTAAGARADEPPIQPGVQPYIDSIRQDLPTPESEGSFIEKEKRKLEEEEPDEDRLKPGESYIDRLKSEQPERFQKTSDEERRQWLQNQQDELRGRPVEDGGSAIQAFHEGRSELKARYLGDIHNAFGLRYGVSLIKDITAPADVAYRPFSDVYGGNYAPDLSVFYEWQPFHSEWFGNIGFYGSVGLGYHNGNGAFQVALSNPSVGNFGTDARTKFQFFTVPVTAGLNYRMNLLRILRPFVIAGPTAIGYVEKRNDQKSGHQGYSTGLFVSGGVSLLMDWFSPGSAWDIYGASGIRHTYLTAEYIKVTTISGDVDFSISGITAGLTFEY